MINTKEAAEKWLKIKKKNLSPKTLEEYERYLKNFLLTLNKDLSEIKKEDCEKYFEEKYEKKEEAKIYAMRVIDQFLDWSWKQHHIKYNPMIYIPIPKSSTDRKEIPVMTKEDIQRILKVAYNSEFLPETNREDQKYMRMMYYTALCLSLFCILHKGELLALKWNCITDEYISIEKNTQFLSKKNVFRNIKKPNGQRKIKLLPTIKKVINNWKTFQENYKTSHKDFKNTKNLIFVNTKGNAMDDKNMDKRWWNPLRKYLQIENIEWKNLRDIGILFWYDEGLSINEIHALSGNSDKRTTKRILEAGKRI